MEVQCNFGNFYNRGVKCATGESAYSYTCCVTKIKSSSTNSVRIEGTHDPSKRDKDVESVSIWNQNIERVPKEFQDVYLNMVHLEINNCNLKLITRDHLRGFEKLTHLILAQNKIRTLPDNLFVDMKSLEKIDLGGNPIEFATSKVLEPFVNNENMTVSLSFKDSDIKEKKSIRDLMQLIDKFCSNPILGQHSADANRLYENSKELWLSGRYSDLKVFVGSTEFRVHKLVLVSQSSVFAEIIDEAATEMIIREFSESAVENLLCFLYTGKASSDVGNIEENFKIAVKFKAYGLADLCEDKLLTFVNEKTALEYFKLSFDLPSKRLRRKAFSIIADSFPCDLTGDSMNDFDAVMDLIKTKSSYDQMLEKLRKK